MGLVWYVAYGSNLSSARLGCYLAGGRPVGAARSYEPGPDPSPPRRCEPCVMRHRLRFAGESTTWGGGGVAFVEPLARPDESTLARRYLISDEQFDDLRDKEGRRLYDLAIDLGEVDGHRSLTLTSSTSAAPNPPSPAYRAMILGGLAESHGLMADAASNYLDLRIGGSVSEG